MPLPRKPAMQGRFMSLFLSKCSRSRMGFSYTPKPIWAAFNRRGMYILAIGSSPCSAQNRLCLLCFHEHYRSGPTKVQTLILHSHGKPLDISGLQQVFITLRKVIKDAGRNADLLVGTVAASCIIGSNEMEIPR